MKRLFVCLLLTSMVFISYGQDKIDGFGKLKLGMSINQIPELQKSVQLTYEEHSHYKNLKNFTCEYISDTSSKFYGIFGPVVKEQRIFQINNFQLTNQVVVSKIYLHFYNNKLYKMEVDDEMIVKLLEIKYGKLKGGIFKYRNTGYDDIFCEEINSVYGINATLGISSINKKIWNEYHSIKEEKTKKENERLIIGF